jgi:hypothetical protein
MLANYGGIRAEGNPNQQGVSTMENPNAEPDRVIWRSELKKELNVCSETIRRYLRDKKLPPPDVNLSLRTKGWKLSTLRAAGIHLV